MNLKTLRFVPLADSHIPEILAIENVSNGSPWSQRSFANELQNSQSIFRVAMADGAIVGYGGLWLIVDEAHVTTVAVAPDARRRGVGIRLMNELLEDARSRGMASATLEVRAGNKAAIEMYERLGFKSVAVRRAYYPDNKEDAIVMWLYDLSAWEARR